MNEDGTKGNEVCDAIRKLFPDYHCHFGDGGEANLDFPVYSMDPFSQPPVHVEEEVQDRLKRQLRAISLLRKDVQPNGIVHDIIDPSLHSRLLTDDEIEAEVTLLNERNKAFRVARARRLSAVTLPCLRVNGHSPSVLPGTCYHNHL